MWRQLACTEWHMADGRLSCEKSKIADNKALTWPYRAAYPRLDWTGTGIDLRSRILQLLAVQGESSCRALATALGKTKPAIQTQLDDLVITNMINVRIGPKNTNLYYKL